MPEFTSVLGCGFVRGALGFSGRGWKIWKGPPGVPTKERWPWGWEGNGLASQCVPECQLLGAGTTMGQRAGTSDH